MTKIDEENPTIRKLREDGWENTGQNIAGLPILSNLSNRNQKCILRKGVSGEKYAPLYYDFVKSR
tara:strand:+ start:938 stop:1132 length:195 start_codon:yes stop_codon:yes gene_type:complete